MAEHYDEKAELVMEFSENGVSIDGHHVPAVILLDAALMWKKHADERGWDLRDMRGRRIHIRPFWEEAV